MKKSNLTPVVYAALYLNKKNPAEKVAFGNSILEKMTGSAVFNAPTPTIPEYTDIVNNLAACVAADEGGTDLNEQNLLDAESAFDIGTRRLADYVQNVANAYAPATAITMVVSTGMSTRKTPERSPVPDAVSTLAAFFTNTPGAILTKWRGVKYARTYGVYYSTEAALAGEWTFAGFAPSKTFTVTGLTSSTRYYIKIVAVGTHGSSEASNIASSIAA